MDKFGQVKLFLLGRLCKPQLDVSLLNDTFLKLNMPDTLFQVLGYSIYRRDRVNKSGSGVMAYINNNLNVLYRTDLENQDVELVWLEVCPFKLKPSLLIGSINCPLSYTKADDLSQEANMECVYLLNEETIFLGNVNIDGRNNKSFDKNGSIKVVHSMNFTHLVNEVTRPVNGTCLDHIYSNHPQRTLNISTLNCGLSDHIAIFAVCKYNNQHAPWSMQKNQNIQYRTMKQFDENQFKEALSQVAWDTVFVFDKIDDMLDSWESIFNIVLNENCTGTKSM